ncbi:glycosyltransferase family A protein [Poritiphilus flavus]|uniref:GNT-I family protein n=1 Tax=Poritiphilus flavus TaxID=2697053 RepID=A0A6L9EA29_9FLAO|nr:hypothetical protein [Poritiphilus flavus]NAS11514.1 hypothetical protein [Poritiphilus flavus]
MKPAIVVVAYNRPDSLKHLLDTIARAEYPDADVPLVISIDYTEGEKHEEVVRVAKDFIWDFGTKKIIEHRENIGLRNHILFCGDLTSQYGSVIILEDDLRVATGYYEYASAASKFYYDVAEVAGISLYAYEYEELGWYRFYPKNIGGDTYFMQWAASWGQLWTDQQWKKFRNWYVHDMDLQSINIPDEVKNWKHSWKKYYIGYLVENDLYYVYPYSSYTTVREYVSEESGTHHKTEMRTNNVALSERIIKRNFAFSGFEHDIIKYDVFFQPVKQKVFVKELNKTLELEFDLFGTKKEKNIRAEYLVSTKSIPDKDRLAAFSNKLIPYEDNLLLYEKGDVFKLGPKSSFHYGEKSFLRRGKTLYHMRKIYAMKEMLLAFVYRLLHKVTG